ncbi:MAG: adenylate/guanylate cyclase domain-containing protein [Anaerolineales bacterium]|nr:MAG: adenylate/guanylate cyclase domain-containing protein [Anaerolineales bacterium]
MSEENPMDTEQLWREWFTTDAFSAEKRIMRRFRLLPHDPRCKFCGAPFEGLGSLFVRAVYSKKRSTLNPRFCNICEHFASANPGGAEVAMSMLFADVRGSTALSEQMSPMEFSRLINRFYIETTKIITSEDGLVEKLAGDAVAAFWGAGFAGPQYVKRTLDAAQKMSNVMKEQNIPVGIGVHAGVAFFGAMGAADGLINISAIGDEVNLAARLASKAAAGEIVVSEKALNEAGADASAYESKSLELKGISEPVRVRVLRG